MAQERKLNIVLYSDDSTTREAITRALGSRVAADLPEHQIREFATAAAMRLYVDGIKPGAANAVDLYILDGEATPAGGMGICRQLKDEIFQCPPVLVLTGRPQDAWLATWSRADAVVPPVLSSFSEAALAAAARICAWTLEM